MTRSLMEQPHEYIKDKVLDFGPKKKLYRRY